MTPKRKQLVKRLVLAGISVAIIAATFAYFLPTIANYGDVWGVVTELSWEWIVALLGATAINLVTFAPPWQVALPGLSFIQALTLTQASTALVDRRAGRRSRSGSPAPTASCGRWGFALRDVTRAITLTGLWNQFLNLTFPIVAVFLLTAWGESTGSRDRRLHRRRRARHHHRRLRADPRERSPRARPGQRRRPVRELGPRQGAPRPVSWNGESFERFRAEAGDFLERRWHLLTLARSREASRCFALLVVSLRALGVDSAQVSWSRRSRRGRSSASSARFRSPPAESA